MKKIPISIIAAAIICPISGWSAASLTPSLNTCNQCNTASCTCRATTHKYCCPEQKTMYTCPNGWLINASCTSCTRAAETVSNSSKHRYETTSYGSCASNQTTRNDCLVSTATDTCGNRMACMKSTGTGGGLIVNPGGGQIFEP